MTTICRGPILPPQVTILVRPGGAIQLGWHPEDSLVLETEGLETDTVLGFLRLLDGSHTRPQILWQANEYGITPEQALALLDLIDTAELLEHPVDRAWQVTEVRIHGLGPLSDALTTGARRMGLHPSRSHEYGANTPPVRTWHTDLVILADALIPDPHLVDELVRHRIPHLPVRVRDGRGMVGPLVLPGATSCLRCADLRRADNDADWPHLAAQLYGRVGSASPATIAATAAIALGELESISSLSARRPPVTLDTTVELDPHSHLVQQRRWIRHRDCVCRGLHAEVSE
ncbi:TOMM precursor leader peptide-binding protein [Nocardia callitridis]|uniref:Cyclodehydratase n=1 Tax=Nocardia callitridis TaxID=648753 RepID=A0ABP9JS06_9NOCA